MWSGRVDTRFGYSQTLLKRPPSLQRTQQVRSQKVRNPVPPEELIVKFNQPAYLCTKPTQVNLCSVSSRHTSNVTTSFGWQWTSYPHKHLQFLANKSFPQVKRRVLPATTTLIQ